MDRHSHAHANIHGHAEEIDMQQRAGDRIDLPILHHGLLFFSAGELHGENRVVPGFRTENFRDLLGVHRERNCVSLAAVENGGNHARKPNAPRRTCSARIASRAFQDQFLHTTFLYFLDQKTK